ncbi:MAG: hypothetical protein EOP82_29425 [Variovorax sp.]|nr:MAG: hypothetical protein EOP82_29425 [Variovorax sp.]
MTEIKAPLVKSTTAIAAAIGANTEAAGQAATSVVEAIAPTSDPVWYWFIVSLPWDKIASFVAAVYTMMLASEWLFKKIWRAWLRPMAVRRGWAPGEPLLTRSQWLALREDD